MADQNQNGTQLDEIFNSFNPIALVMGATILGVAGLFAPDVSDSVRISFAGAAATGFGAAAGLARSPERKGSVVDSIQRADKVDVSM